MPSYQRFSHSPSPPHLPSAASLLLPSQSHPPIDFPPSILSLTPLSLLSLTSLFSLSLKPLLYPPHISTTVTFQFLKCAYLSSDPWPLLILFPLWRRGSPTPSPPSLQLLCLIRSNMISVWITSLHFTPLPPVYAQVYLYSTPF